MTPRPPPGPAPPQARKAIRRKAIRCPAGRAMFSSGCTRQHDPRARSAGFAHHGLLRRSAAARPSAPECRSCPRLRRGSGSRRSAAGWRSPDRPAPITTPVAGSNSARSSALPVAADGSRGRAPRSAARSGRRSKSLRALRQPEQRRGPSLRATGRRARACPRGCALSLTRSNPSAAVARASTAAGIRARKTSSSSIRPNGSSPPPIRSPGQRGGSRSRRSRPGCSPRRAPPPRRRAPRGRCRRPPPRG